jgi:hypothetical protein
MDTRDLSEFAFSLYDLDGDGTLTMASDGLPSFVSNAFASQLRLLVSTLQHDFEELVMEVYGTLYEGNPVIQLVLKVITDKKTDRLSKRNNCRAIPSALHVTCIVLCISLVQRSSWS